MLDKKELLLFLFCAFLWLFGEVPWVLAIIGAFFVILGFFVKILSTTFGKYLLGSFVLSLGYCFLTKPQIAFVPMMLIFLFVYRNRKELERRFLENKFYPDRRITSLLFVLLYFSFVLVEGKGIGVRLVGNLW